MVEKKKGNFRSDLKRGLQGEALFMEYFGEYLEVVEERKADFVLKDTNELVELKTDFRERDATGNMFIERWSDVFERKPGGPWQSKKNGVKHFVYFYPKDKVCYWFDIKKLIKFMEATFDNSKLICVNNYRWWSAGYKVPIKLVADLAWIIKVDG